MNLATAQITETAAFGDGARLLGRVEGFYRLHFIRARPSSPSSYMEFSHVHVRRVFSHTVLESCFAGKRLREDNVIGGNLASEQEWHAGRQSYGSEHF